MIDLRLKNTEAEALFEMLRRPNPVDEYAKPIPEIRERLAKSLGRDPNELKYKLTQPRGIKFY